MFCIDREHVSVARNDPLSPLPQVLRHCHCYEGYGRETCIFPVLCAVISPWRVLINSRLGWTRVDSGRSRTPFTVTAVSVGERIAKFCNVITDFILVPNGYEDMLPVCHLVQNKQRISSKGSYYNIIFQKILNSFEAVKTTNNF